MPFRYIVDILFFFILPTAISVFAENRVVRSNEKTGKRILVYLSCYIFLMAFIKAVLGEYEYTIFESFSENSTVTYVRYLIPVLGMGAIMLFLNKNIHKRAHKLWDYEYLAASIIMSSWISIMMFYGKIINIVIVVCMVAGVLITALLGILKRVSDKDKELSIKERLRYALMVTGFWTISVVFFDPNKIYLTNTYEFNIQYIYFFCTLLIGSVLIIAVLSAFGCLIHASVMRLWLTIVFLVTLIGYIQENFLNGQMRRMDGKEQIWTNNQNNLNICIWILFVIIGVLLYIKFKDRFIKAAGIVSVYICLIQMFTVGYLAITTDMSEGKYILTNDGVFELSNKKNTIVFILDWYDEQILEEIVENDSDFLEPLDGFIWYKNQTSRYAYTQSSLPYLLTGVKWDEELKDRGYVIKAYEKEEFLHDIRDCGYGIGIYTDTQNVIDHDSLVDNYTDTRGTCVFTETIRVMSNCSRYDMAPLLLKNRFHYTSGSTTDMLPPEDRFSIDNLNFYNMLKDKGISISNKYENGVFRLYHINGVHDCEINENLEPVEGGDIYSCGKGVMCIVYEFIEELKMYPELYDDSTIIITADHGQNTFIEIGTTKHENSLNLKKPTSSPICLVKYPDERGEIVVSNAPISHDDFCATVLESMGGDYSKYGRTYFEIPENEKRVREFEYYRYGDTPYKRFLIDGIATDENSWTLDKEEK